MFVFRVRSFVSLCCFVFAGWGLGGCNVGEIGLPLGPDTADPRPDDPDIPGERLDVSLRIVAPEAESVHVRDVVGKGGNLVALVPIVVEAGGPLARMEVLAAGGEVLGLIGDDGVLFAELFADGPEEVTVVGYDDLGHVLVDDRVDIVIEPARARDCYERLALYEVDYSPGPSRGGVAHPVTVTTPINGVAYRYIARRDVRDTFFMDCALAVSLAESAYHLRKRDIIEVADIGVYNYRCIGGEGTPPDCPRGLSQHAHATALDIGGFTTGDGTFYSVTHDWVIDSGEPTCAAATEPGKDDFLHRAICDLKADKVWNIVLTPNYNDAHRDHFHVDLTAGSDYIKGFGVDIGPDLH